MEEGEPGVEVPPVAVEEAVTCPEPEFAGGPLTAVQLPLGAWGWLSEIWVMGCKQPKLVGTLEACTSPPPMEDTVNDKLDDGLGTTIEDAIGAADAELAPAPDPDGHWKSMAQKNVPPRQA